MINFLSPVERSAVRRLYRERVAVVASVALSSALFAGAALLAPDLLILRTSLALARADHAEARATLAALEPLADEAARLSARLGRLAALDTPRVAPTDVLAFVAQYRPALVRVARVAFDGTRVTLGGTARSRATLRTFQDALARDPRVTALDAPISNFIAGKDLAFTLSFVFAPRP